jgi:hypothetical protein
LIENYPSGARHSTVPGLKPAHYAPLFRSLKAPAPSDFWTLVIRQTLPKARVISGHLAARLKSCPFKTSPPARFSGSCEVAPFQNRGLSSILGRSSERDFSTVPNIDWTRVGRMLLLSRASSYPDLAVALSPSVSPKSGVMGQDSSA